MKLKGAQEVVARSSTRRWRAITAEWSASIAMHCEAAMPPDTRRLQLDSAAAQAEHPAALGENLRQQLQSTGPEIPKACLPSRSKLHVRKLWQSPGRTWNRYYGHKAARPLKFCPALRVTQPSSSR